MGCLAFPYVHRAVSTNRSWAPLTHCGLGGFPGPAGHGPDLQHCSYHPPQREEAGLDRKQALGTSLHWVSGARAHNREKSLLEKHLRPKAEGGKRVGINEEESGSADWTTGLFKWH